MQKFICKICGQNFNTPFSFKKHLEKQHNIGLIEYREQCKDINNTYIPNSIEYCQICGTHIKEGKNGYVRSISFHLKETKCDTFQNYFESHLNFFSKKEINYFNKRFKKDINNNKPFNCAVCGEFFLDKSSYVNHIKKIHKLSDEQYSIKYNNTQSKTCGICEKPTTFKNIVDGYYDYCDYCRVRVKPSQLPYWVIKKGIKDKDEAEIQRRLYLSNIFKSKRSSRNVSKASNAFFKELFGLLPHEIKQNVYYDEFRGEYNIWCSAKQKLFFFDFVITGNIKICIEYNGEKFHAKEGIFGDNETPNPYDKTLTAATIRANDKFKLDYLFETRGIKTLVIWHNDVKNNINCELQKALKFIKENNPNESCK